MKFTGYFVRTNANRRAGRGGRPVVAGAYRGPGA